MSREIAIRAGALYGPLMLAAVGALLPTGRRPGDCSRRWAGVLVSSLWVLPVLWALQLLNLSAGWWTFAVAGPAVRGMPLELFLGWVILWGAVPLLLLGRLRPVWRAAILVALDLLLMPRLVPVLRLSTGWLFGEAVGIGAALLPSLLLGEWTMAQRFPARRAGMQVVMAGMVVFFVLPELIFTLRGGGWALETGPVLNLELQVVLLLGVPGIAAALEFGGRGEGTPIPFDPPRKLVVSGIYRYTANLMQVSCAMVMLAWAGVIRNGWMAAGALCGVVYSAGLARWDEDLDLEARFGYWWQRYRGGVHDWRLRWRPFIEESLPPARLYVSEECGPCSEVRQWLERRNPIGMTILAAEEHPTRRLTRLTYEDGEYTATGVAAMARALEHIHFGWAYAGMVLRMPGILWLVQTVMDGVGLGERPVCWRRKEVG